MKTVSLLLFTLIATTAWGQEKSIEVELGIRYNLPANTFNSEVPGWDTQKSGAGLKAMPKWNLSNKKSIGVNFGINLIGEDARGSDIGTFVIFSYVPTFQHQLLDTKFSPFYSVGLGGYSVLNSETAIAPGFSVSLGTTLFRKGSIAFEYNHLLTDVEVDDAFFNDFDRWNFYGIVLGYDIGIK